MRASLKTLLLVGALGALALGAPMVAKADHRSPYWRGYWGWYDSTYVPYYQSYSYGPSPYYGPTYVSPPAYSYGYTYGPSPYVSGYYASPNVGVQIGVGPRRMRYGWW